MPGPAGSTGLAVELYGVPVGELVGTSPGSFDFRASPSGRDSFGLSSTILSESVPLDAVPNRGRSAQRRNFFTELLPEGDLRAYVAGQARLSENDTIGLLSHYGRDVAGALQIWDPLNPGEPRTPFASPVDDATIADLLRDVRTSPLGNAVETGKSLINGVQTKILLVHDADGWKRPGDGYPSTHILKPQLDPKSSIVFDEEYGARIARILGLAQHETRLDAFDGISTLVIQRYDRSPSSPDGRIHQEDMNQALGAGGSEKYQRLGGKVSLARIARLLQTLGDNESLTRLARLTVLATAVGNLDMHAKNISLLHPFDAPRRLAPAYDVVPMAHLDNDPEMALAVDGVYAHARLTRDDLVCEIQGWGLRGTSSLVSATLEEILAVTESEAPADGAWGGLHDDIVTFTSNLLSGREVGLSARFA